MANYIIFAVALICAQSVYARSYGDMRAETYQSYNSDDNQPKLIRKTRSDTCDSRCSSDEDCAGSNTCGKCCWWFYYGNICTDPESVASCLSPKSPEIIVHIATAGGIAKTLWSLGK